MEKTYTSPLRKLASFFENSRDGWKDKCKEAKSKIKKDYIRIRDLKASRDAWKAKAMALQKKIAVLEQQVRQSDTKKKTNAVLSSPSTPQR